jgi:sodium/pantothenate symporter
MGVIACCVFMQLIFGLYRDRGTQTGFIAGLLAFFLSVAAWNLFIGLICGTVALRGEKSGDEPPQ